jgi:hypothetical protein
MAKKKIRDREGVVNMIAKMNSEGGAYYYFNHYTSIRSLVEEMPFLPVKFRQAAENFENASLDLHEAIEDLRRNYDISEEEVNE